MLVERVPAWVTQTNAYVVAAESGSHAVLVDAPPEPETVGRIIRRLGVAVVAVVLTHGHVDHTGGSARLAGGAATYVHPDDDFLTLDPISQLKSLFGLIPPGEYEVPETLERLYHGQKLDLAGVTLEVRHTPGHTPGHCCFYWAEEGILFSGDQLFAGSVGRTDLEGGSFTQLMRSMEEQVLTLDDEVRVLPGHGPETTIGRERRTNPFLRELRA